MQMFQTLHLTSPDKTHLFLNLLVCSTCFSSFRFFRGRLWPIYFLLSKIVISINFETFQDIEIENKASFTNLDCCLLLLITILILRTLISLKGVAGVNNFGFFEFLNDSMLPLPDSLYDKMIQFPGITT